MLPPNLVFEPLRPEERRLGVAMLGGTLEDPDVMAQVNAHHAENERCAVIVLMEGGEFSNGWVANEIATKDLLPFEQVTEALASYDPSDSVCFILVRDNLVSVSIGGRLGSP